MLERPSNLVLQYLLCFNFQTSNNQAEYEILISGMKLSKEVGITHLLVRTNSQLVVGQVGGEFQTKDPTFLKYIQQRSHFAEISTIGYAAVEGVP